MSTDTQTLPPTVAMTTATATATAAPTNQFLFSVAPKSDPADVRVYGCYPTLREMEKEIALVTKTEGFTDDHTVRLFGTKVTKTQAEKKGICLIRTAVTASEELGMSPQDVKKQKRAMKRKRDAADDGGAAPAEKRAPSKYNILVKVAVGLRRARDIKNNAVGIVERDGVKVEDKKAYNAEVFKEGVSIYKSLPRGDDGKVDPEAMNAKIEELQAEFETFNSSSQE